MQSINPRRRGVAASIAVAGAALLLWVFPIGATAAVYPPGGGAFTADIEGWQVTEAGCNLPLICEAFGEHDAAEGNPPGSIRARTKVILALLNAITSNVAFESPEFTVSDDGVADLHLDRQFVPVQLAVPKASYTVTLKNTSAGTEEEVLAEPLEAASPTFAEQDVAVDVNSGDSYAIAIEVETKATVELGLLGDASVRFDNVALAVQEASGEEDGGEDSGKEEGDDKSGDGDSGGAPSGEAGAGGTGDSNTSSTLGKLVFVRVRCPKRAGGACRITAQGRIKKRVRVTQRRTVRVAKGRSRLVALRVKPRYREKVAGRKRLLVVQEVRVGKVTTTYARSRALVRRP